MLFKPLSLWYFVLAGLANQTNRTWSSQIGKQILDRLKQVSGNLESDELLLPGMKSRQIDLPEGLMAHSEVDPIRSDCELEGDGLVSFRHDQRDPGMTRADRTR